MAARRLLRALGALAVIGPLHAAADELAPINPAPGAQTWSWEAEGISVRLTQILPDQLRGFYLARGFGADAAERIARACVFQTVIRNAGAGQTVDIDLHRWRTLAGGDRQPLEIKEDWLAQWEAEGAPPHARLAFRWALFPTTHTFRTGDWNMGMTFTGRPPAASFDLEVEFAVGERIVRGTITGLQCAAGTARQGAGAS
jgi:hypothetical protein